MKKILRVKLENIVAIVLIIFFTYCIIKHMIINGLILNILIQEIIIYGLATIIAYISLYVIRKTLLNN